jgi:hypothetical protein
MSGPMSLADMIVKLRKDLRQAQEQAANENLRFQVEEIELEVQVVTAIEGEGKIGVNFWVYTAEAGGGLRREDAHTLRLKLKPLVDGGDQPANLLLSDKDE